jgi:hypothetical protein
VVVKCGLIVAVKCGLIVAVKCGLKPNATPGIKERRINTSPTGGGRSVGIVRSRTKAMEFSLV